MALVRVESREKRDANLSHLQQVYLFFDTVFVLGRQIMKIWSSKSCIYKSGKLNYKKNPFLNRHKSVHRKCIFLICFYLHGPISRVIESQGKTSPFHWLNRIKRLIKNFACASVWMCGNSACTIVKILPPLRPPQSQQKYCRSCWIKVRTKKWKQKHTETNTNIVFLTIKMTNDTCFEKFEISGSFEGTRFCFFVVLINNKANDLLCLHF